MYRVFTDGFAEELERIDGMDIPSELACMAGDNVKSALSGNTLREEDFLAFLSPAAAPFIEQIAQIANAETLRNFGRSIQLFTPLYLANHCTNRCVYCGFSARRDIPRLKLTPAEVEKEAKAIASTGLRKILALTGDAPATTGPEYLAGCVAVLTRHFTSVGIETPAMTVEEYALQVEAGADSMTMFQETYNARRYEELHPSGPKRDFWFRLDAPQRALIGGMRSVNLGPLLGLGDWREDVFHVGLHARWLMEHYPEAEVSISLPRMRPHTEGGEVRFQPVRVDNAEFVQALVALRCFLPKAGITMSSRESAWLRDKLLPLGVTRISAGVCTTVGGHSKKADSSNAEETGKPQFDISDDRSVSEMTEALLAMGYQPVFSDWLLPGCGESKLTRGVSEALRSPNS